MTRHQSAAALPPTDHAADAMPKALDFRRRRMAAGRPGFGSGRPVTPWILLAVGVAILAAATGIWVGAWAAGGFPLGATSPGADSLAAPPASE